MKRRWLRVLAWVFAAYMLAGAVGWAFFLWVWCLDRPSRWETPEAADGVPPEAAVTWFPGGGSSGEVVP